jgi:hypothetical protein
MDPQRKQELLDQLRGLELPPEPGLWPLAPGWWLALGLLIALLAGWLIVRHIRKPTWKKSALREHRRISAQIQDSVAAPAQALAALSVLMRRVALAVNGRSGAAALTDGDWLSALDSLSKSTEYTHGAGALLQRHPYMPIAQIEPGALAELLALTERTIRTADRTRPAVMPNQSPEADGVRL